MPEGILCSFVYETEEVLMRRRTLSIVAIAVTACGLLLPAASARPFDAGTGTAPCGATGTITWTPARMWPPNHKMRPVTVTYTEAVADGDTLTLQVNSITDNEAAS